MIFGIIELYSCLFKNVKSKKIGESTRLKEKNNKFIKNEIFFL